MDDRTVVVACESSDPLPSVSKLWQYFEDVDKSGGGTVDRVDTQANGTALVVFRKPEDAVNVEVRDHEVGGVGLVVYPHYGDRDDNDDGGYDNTASLTRKAVPALPVRTCEFNMAQGKIKYFKHFPSAELKALMGQFDECQLFESQVKLQGHSDDFDAKVMKLKISFLNVKEDMFEVNKPLAFAYLHSEQGQKDLAKIGQKFKCSFQIDQGLYCSTDSGDLQTASSEEGTAATKTEVGVTLVTGDVTQQEVDVIVCCVCSDLDLATGDLSSTLLRMGGQGLQVTCREKNPDGLKVKDMVKVNGGFLDCKEIYFVCLPEYKDDQQMKAFGSIIYKSLYQATESGHTSIALPALGTGSRGYPAEKVAKMTFFKIASFLTYSTSLQDIRIVVPRNNATILRMFEAEKPMIQFHKTEEKDTEEARETQPVLESKDSVRIGKLTIHIKQGVLCADNCQAVVNFISTAQKLRQGSHASDLLHACDDDINRLCGLALRDLTKKGITTTRAPGLPSDHIVHVAADHFQGRLKDITSACLKKAADLKLSSIAFPVFWDGSDGTNMEKIVKLFVMCMEEFERKQTTVKDISVVIEDDTSCALFLSLLEQIIRNKKRNKKSRFSYRKRIDSDGQTSTKTLFPSEQVYAKQASESDAEVTVYGGDEGSVGQARREVLKLCDTHLVKETFVHSRLTSFNKQQISQLKQRLDVMNIYVTVTWSTGTIEMEGLARDIEKLKEVVHNI